MDHGLRILTAALALSLGSQLALPQLADARSSSRRNYAEAWEREEREEEYREERERERQEWREHQKEQQERYLEHEERQRDTTFDRIGLPDPAAPPPRKAGGSCIYGDGNKVIYQPDGVDCTLK